jgi:hypothetical protein
MKSRLSTPTASIRAGLPPDPQGGGGGDDCWNIGLANQLMHKCPNADYANRSRFHTNRNYRCGLALFPRSSFQPIDRPMVVEFWLAVTARGHADAGSSPYTRNGLRPRVKLLRHCRGFHQAGCSPQHIRSACVNRTSAENFPARSVDSRIKTSFDDVNVGAVYSSAWKFSTWDVSVTLGPAPGRRRLRICRRAANRRDRQLFRSEIGPIAVH